MADDQQRNPNDPWVAPPLGSDGASGSGYADPFAQSATPPQPPYGAQPAPQYAATGWSQPYGAPGQPGAPRTDKNWMGITSLILSIVGISLGGIILGHMGLGAAKRGEANNRGLALAGTILGWIGMVGFVVLMLAAVAIPVYLNQQEASTSTAGDEFVWTEPTSEPTTDPTPYATDGTEEDVYAGLAQPGDGVFGLDEATGYFLIFVDGDLTPGNCLAPSTTTGYDLDMVDCAEPHVGELYAVATLGDLIVDDDPYSTDSWTAYSAVCNAEFGPYLDEDGAAITNQWLFAASEDVELTADDVLLCVASDEFSETTGTLAGSGGTVY